MGMKGVRWNHRHGVYPFFLTRSNAACGRVVKGESHALEGRLTNRPKFVSFAVFVGYGLEIAVCVTPTIFDRSVIFLGSIGITDTIARRGSGCFVVFAFSFVVKFGGSGVKVIFEEVGHLLEFEGIDHFDAITFGGVGHIGEVDLVEVAHEAFFFGAIDQVEAGTDTKQGLAELANLAQETLKGCDGAALEVHEIVFAVHFDSSGVAEVTSAAGFPIVGAVPAGVWAFSDQTTRPHAMAGVMHGLFDGGIGAQRIVAKASRDGIIVTIGTKGHGATEAEEDDFDRIVHIACDAVVEFAFGFVVTGGLVDTDHGVANEFLFTEDLKAETLELGVLFHLFAEGERATLFGACQFVSCHLWILRRCGVGKGCATKVIAKRFMLTHCNEGGVRSCQRKKIAGDHG